MKRLELFEFEDFDWLPNVIRSGATNLIMVLHRLLGTADVLVERITYCRQKVSFDIIVDLGSGSGGPMLDVIKKLNAKGQDAVDLLLTDKYPNNTIISKINSSNIPNVSYSEASVDAQEMGQTPNGLKTMIASFHHMKPPVAKTILNSSARNKQPILIYEIAENTIPVILWWLLLPVSLVVLILMSLVLTLFVRPLTVTQVIFTYLIPIIPLVYAWDGQASIMRTYTFEDIDGLIDERNDASYTWEISKARKANGKSAGYYVFGYPKI